MIGLELINFTNSMRNIMKITNGNKFYFLLFLFSCELIALIALSGMAGNSVCDESFGVEVNMLSVEPFLLLR